MDKTTKTNGMSENFLPPSLNAKDVEYIINNYLSNPRNISVMLDVIVGYMKLGISNEPEIKWLKERVEYLERWRDVAIKIFEKHNLKDKFNEECRKVFENHNINN